MPLEPFAAERPDENSSTLAQNKCWVTWKGKFPLCPLILWYLQQGHTLGRAEFDPLPDVWASLTLC